MFITHFIFRLNKDYVRFDVHYNEGCYSYIDLLDNVLEYGYSVYIVNREFIKEIFNMPVNDAIKLSRMLEDEFEIIRKIAGH